VTSLERELGEAPADAHVADTLVRHFVRVFGHDIPVA
jgi:hypothetical protein